MKRLIILMAIVLLVVTGMVIYTKSLKSQQLKLAYDEIPPDENRLKWYATKARDQGVSEVQIASPWVEYLGTASANLKDVLSDYSLVIARPTESKTIIDETDHIVTWYKFETVEFLSKTEKPACLTCPIPSPPNEMFPLSENEFVAGKYGGTVEVDGVKITMTNNQFPDFRTDKEYLLFIARYDNGAATIGMGPNSIFTVENGERLQRFNGLPNAIKEQIEHEYEKSLPSVRMQAKQIQENRKRNEDDR